jgi:hypothetical protein
MAVKFHANRDLLSGLMFAAWGVAGLWLGRDIPTGSALRMGPGYMPRLLCWGLILLGGIIAIKGMAVPGEKMTRWHLRSVVLLLLSVLAFAALIEPAGLPIAAFVIVLLGAYAGREFRLVEAVLLAFGLAAGAVGLFVYGLRLPMLVWPFG